MDIKTIQKAEKDKKAIFGSDKIIKELKSEGLAEIILASNCPQELKNSIINLAKLSNTKVEVVEHTNEELGIKCKRPFSISVIGIEK